MIKDYSDNYFLIVMIMKWKLGFSNTYIKLGEQFLLLLPPQPRWQRGMCSVRHGTCQRCLLYSCDDFDRNMFPPVEDRSANKRRKKGLKGFLMKHENTTSYPTYISLSGIYFFIQTSNKQ